MIKLKNKTCIICGREDQPWFSKKRCKGCASKSYAKASTIPKKTKKTYTSFFKECAIVLPNFCQESGKPLNINAFNCAHIFPKRKYKSIDEDFDNIIILDLQHHTTLDNHLDKMEFDKIKEKLPNTYKIIMERLDILLPSITETDGKLYQKCLEILENK